MHLFIGNTGNRIALNVFSNWCCKYQNKCFEFMQTIFNEIKYIVIEINAS